MKVILTCSVTLLIIFGLAITESAAGIANTVHNLSTTAPEVIPGLSYATDETQICIFCHTPHGGNNSGPLWNKDLPPAAGWEFYTSASVGSIVKAVAAINAESLLCLSCHDGSISVNHVLNYGTLPAITTVANGQTDTYIAGRPDGNPQIGGNPADPAATGKLGDDHPISFSYQAVYTTDYLNGARPGLKAPGSIPSALRLFSGSRVECSTCHDPHTDDPALAPFLNMSNTGSAMCLGCHDK